MPAVPSPPPPPLPSLEGSLKPKTSTLAIWSLVLGILSIFTCGVTALPGLITGIMGISATGERGKGLGGRGMAIAGVVLSSLALLALIPLALTVPAYTKVAEKAKLTKSVSQVRQLGLILQQYALDGDGNLPADWATAFEATGMSDNRLLRSPLGDSAEYLLLKPGANLDELAPDTAIVRDPHQLDGQTVEGYANGAVKIVPAEESLQ